MDLSTQRAAERHPAPFEGHSWPTVAFVLLALCPDLLLSTALPVLRESLGSALRAAPASLSLGETFSNAGWAFGAVLAADLAQRVAGWKLNVVYAAAFSGGCVLAALAPTPALVVAGRVVQGTATGMLLVSALPPIIRGFPPSRLPITADVVNLALFGAVTAGPVLGGGVVAKTGAWRRRCWALARA